MFTLLSGLWKYMFQKDEYFVLILGLDNAGKTSLPVQVLINGYSSMATADNGLESNSVMDIIEMTLNVLQIVPLASINLPLTYLEQTKTKFTKSYKGINLSKITATVGLNIGKVDIGSSRLNFWDLGGQEDLQLLWDKYYAESHAVIFIVDSVDRERLRESKRSFDTMIGNATVSGIPLLLLANKQDLEDCMTVADIRKVFRESSHLMGHRESMLAGISALKGDGIDEGIEWLLESIQRNNCNRPPTKKDIR